MAAQEATRSMGHNVVDTEQLLLGILSTNDNEAAKALSELGVSLETAPGRSSKYDWPWHQV